ncbi:MAG: hypothetical protein V1809_16115 [Planctomycetota bacterium]
MGKWIAGIGIVVAIVFVVWFVARENPSAKVSDGKTKLTGRDVKSDEIDISTEPFAKDILYLMKDGNPLVLADMMPEAGKLAGHNEAARERYLMRRALQMVFEGLVKESKFAEQKQFVVSMILLKERDEYGRPQWATAPQLARFTVQPTIRSKEDIEILATDQLMSQFSATKFNTAALGSKGR